MRATLKNYRQSPRKVRLVTDLIKGKTVDEALRILTHTPKRATGQIVKLIKSAVANTDGSARDLTIANIRVDKGVVLKRIRPVSRGAAHLIRKRTSHISLALSKKQETK